MLKYAATASAAALLCTGFASAGLAAGELGEVQSQNGHEFACTGVGDAQQELAKWDRFPLKLVFTNVDGDYVANVAVTLKDADGQVLVETDCDAPWFVADVEEGEYTADLTAHGDYEKAVTFTVEGDQQTRVVVPYDETTDT